MKFNSTKLEDAVVIELERHGDERGFFARVWCRDEFADHGLVPNLAQCSISRNSLSGTLRGMHFQKPPHEETKLVRCTAGAIYDVIIDLRVDSRTYGEWIGVELRADEGKALYVPKGFAHGFQTLVDDTDVLYMIADPYVPDAASGVRWDDPAFSIEWPHAEHRTISDRDRAWADYQFASRRSRGA